MFRSLLTVCSGFLFCFITIGSLPASASTPAEERSACKAKGDRYEPEAEFSGGSNSVIVGYKCNLSPLHQEKQKECKDALKDLDEYVKGDSDFMKACAANKSSDARKCLASAATCRRCVGASEDDDDYDTYCEDDDDDSVDDDDSGVNGIESIEDIMAARDGRQPLKRRGRGKDSDEAKRYRYLFKQCPIFAVEKFDEIREDKETQKEAMEAADEGITEITNDLKKAQAELEEVQQRQMKLLPDYQENVQEARKTSSDRLAKKFQENADNIVELVFAFQTAEMQYAEAERNIYQICHQRAVEALDRYKADRAAKISRGQLRTKKGFSSLTGLRSKENRLEAYAKSIRNRCLKKDPLVKKQMDSISRVHNQNMARLNIQMDKAKAKQNDIAQQMLGNAEEPELQQELKALNKQFQADNTRIGNEVKQALIRVENLQTLLAQAQQKKIEAEYLYDMYLDQESSAKSAGVTRGKEVTADEFVPQAAAYIADLESAYYYSCNCDGRETGETATGDPGLCTKLLNKWGESAEAFGVPTPEGYSTGSQ